MNYTGVNNAISGDFFFLFNLAGNKIYEVRGFLLKTSIKSDRQALKTCEVSE